MIAIGRSARFIRLVGATAIAAFLSWFIWPTLRPIPYCTISCEARHVAWEWSLDGRTLLGFTLASGHSWQTWEMPSGLLAADSGDLGDRFKQVILDPLGRVVAGCSKDGGEVVIWDAKKATQIACTRMPRFETYDLNLQFTPDGSTLVAFSTYAKDGQVLLLNPVDGKLRAMLPKQSGPIAFSTDGQLIATTQQIDSNETRINTWQLSSAELTQSMLDQRVSQENESDRFSRRYIAFTSDGSHLGTFVHDMIPLRLGDETTRVRQWNVATGKLEHQSQRKLFLTIQGCQATWDRLYDYKRDEEANHHKLVNAISGNECLSFSAEGQPSMGWECGFDRTPRFQICPCPDRPYVAISESEVAREEWWERYLSLLGWQQPHPSTTAVSLYDFDTQRRVACWQGEYFETFSQDGQFFATKARDPGRFRIYRLLPDRPWWYLVVGWLGLLSSVEVCVWLASGLGRLLFLRVT
jgi:WD40 repeat protein